jgi:DNA-binding transcriptional regulator YhcF (GntR family)
MTAQAVGLAYEGGPWTSASVLSGTRRGYDISQVVTPDIYARTTVEQRASLRTLLRYRPHEQIVWQADGRGGMWWTTRLANDLEREVMRSARKRERGLRGSLRSMASKLDVSVSTLRRVLGQLVKRGYVTLSTGRGRYAMAVVRVVARSMHQPIGSRVGALNSYVDGATRKYLARFSEEEIAELQARRYAFRVTMLHEAREAGFGQDVEAYLASCRLVYAR